MCENGWLNYSCNELKAREHGLVLLPFSKTTLEAACVDRCAIFQVFPGLSLAIKQLHGQLLEVMQNCCCEHANQHPTLQETLI